MDIAKSESLLQRVDKVKVDKVQLESLIQEVDKAKLQNLFQKVDNVQSERLFQKIEIKIVRLHVGKKKKERKRDSKS